MVDMNASKPNVTSMAEIAAMHNEPVELLRYAAKRDGILPVARAGFVWLYSVDDVGRILAARRRTRPCKRRKLVAAAASGGTP